MELLVLVLLLITGGRGKGGLKGKEIIHLLWGSIFLGGRVKNIVMDKGGLVAVFAPEVLFYC